MRWAVASYGVDEDRCFDGVRTGDNGKSRKGSVKVEEVAHLDIEGSSQYGDALNLRNRAVLVSTYFL